MHSRRVLAPPRASGGIVRVLSRRTSPGTFGDASKAPSRNRRRRVAAVAACAPNQVPGASPSAIVSTRYTRCVVARARDDSRDGDTDTPSSPEDDDGDDFASDDANANVNAVEEPGAYEHEDEDEEYEEVEVEVEVDYTPLDHVRDAVDSLGTWDDVASWRRTYSGIGAQSNVESSFAESSPADATTHRPPSTSTSTSFAVQATRPFSAGANGGLSMVPVSGLAVAFAFVVGAVFGRVSAEAKGNAAAGVLADLASRASSGGGGGDNTTFIPMTEEQRIEDEKKKEKKKEDALRQELRRRKKRDEDEAKFVASELVRLEKERLALVKAEEDENKRREKIRAELAERAEIERMYLDEKREREDAETAEKERIAAAEFERKRETKRVAAALLLSTQNAERVRRGETSKQFQVVCSVAFQFRASQGDVEVEVKARAGNSSVSLETGVYQSPARARIAATNFCTSVAKNAVGQWSSDMRLKVMTGDASGTDHPLNKQHGGFDDTEFEHWGRVAGARLDQELRSLTQRAGAGLEFKIRTPGGGESNQDSRNETNLVIERPGLPLSDPDNVPNRLFASLLAAGDDAFGVAAEDLEWVSRFELGQLHGLQGGLCFPPVSAADINNPDKRLKGKLLATMLTLSHWLQVGRVELLGSSSSDPSTSDADPSSKKIYNNCVALANKILTTEANAEGASWKAMYLDGFSGDVLSQAASTARAVLEEKDPIRVMLEQVRIARFPNPDTLFYRSWRLFVHTSRYTRLTLFVREHRRRRNNAGNSRAFPRLTKTNTRTARKAGKRGTNWNATPCLLRSVFGACGTRRRRWRARGRKDRRGLCWKTRFSCEVRRLKKRSRSEWRKATGRRKRRCTKKAKKRNPSCYPSCAPLKICSPRRKRGSRNLWGCARRC